jgi:hypothetical protein
VIVLQIAWTVHAIRSERRAPYDAGKATEQFLVQNYQGKRVAGFTFETVSTQPYAPHNLYFNWRHAYFDWGSNYVVTQRRTETLAAHPDAVVIGDFIVGDDDILDQWFTLLPPGRHTWAAMFQFWEENGYVETHRFCGDRFIRMGTSNRVCEAILEPVRGSDSAGRKR